MSEQILQCAICGEVVTVPGLCGNCTEGLNCFDYSPYLLMRALRYLHETETAVYETSTHIVEKNCPEQTRGFIEMIEKMYHVHLDKNADYSPANILGTGEVGLATRVWDKVMRLLALMGFRIEISASSFLAPHSPKNESIDDNLIDGANYLVIWRLLREGVWGK